MYNFCKLVTSGNAANFHYNITIRLSDVDDIKSDEVSGWSVQRTLKDFQSFHESLKKVITFLMHICFICRKNNLLISF